MGLGALGLAHCPGPVLPTSVSLPSVWDHPGLSRGPDRKGTVGLKVTECGVRGYHIRMLPSKLAFTFIPGRDASLWQIAEV